MLLTEFIDSLPEHRNKRFFLQRLEGLTLEEIGNKAGGISRERVRQVLVKIIAIKPELEEDMYSEAYQKYDMKQPEFCEIFDVKPIVYRYLTAVYGTRGDTPLIALCDDTNYSYSIRKKAENYVYKDHLKFGNERVVKSREGIAYYLLRKYFREDSHIDDFAKLYNKTVKQLGLDDDPRFVLCIRTYETRFGLDKNVLWKHGRKLRYYESSNYDFADFFEELNLSQYKNAIYSSLYFFRKHFSLMKRYDIRDQYELHNLLKTLCNKKRDYDITFGRMPTMRFGKATRYEQIYKLIQRISPATPMEIALEYENEYGVHKEIFLANFLKDFEIYYSNGVYDLRLEILSNERLEYLKEHLTKDFYELSEIHEIYNKKYPNEDINAINAPTLRSIGYFAYVTYAIVSRYTSAAEFFREKLLISNRIDIRTLPEKYTNKSAFLSQLHTLKDKCVIVEYEPSCYITKDGLLEVGVTDKMILDFCTKVKNFIKPNEYFTITSLKQSGFKHKIFSAPFENTFFESLLQLEKDSFSYLRYGHAKLFKASPSGLTHHEFISIIMQEKTAIAIEELEKLLFEQYGIKTLRAKITQAVSDGPMYYDTVKKKIYISEEIFKTSKKS